MKSSIAFWQSADAVAFNAVAQAIPALYALISDFHLSGLNV
jgi:hypothetical protein